MMLFNDQVCTLEEVDTLTAEEDHERRRGLRVREQRPVKIFEPGTGRYYGGQTEDIGANGLRLELPLWAPLQVGEVLNVHVGLNGRGESLANRRSMIPARVVWVNRRKGRRARQEVGVEFMNTIGSQLGAA